MDDRYSLDHLKLTAKYLVSWNRSSCVELRALNTRDWEDTAGRWRCTWGGYYDDPVAFVRGAMAVSGRSEGVYFVLNPAIRPVLCRAKNRVVPKLNHLTVDDEVACWRWLLVDLDPVRPKGIPSNDEEHTLALARAQQVRDYLLKEGAERLACCDSGNGAHVLLGIDDVNTPAVGRNCKTILERLSAKFSDDRVLIDPVTHNPARLTRLYGTLAMKGTDSPEEGRPHRLSRVLEVYQGGQKVDLAAAEGAGQ